MGFRLWLVGAAGACALLGACEDETLSPQPQPVEAIYGEPTETALVPFPSDRMAVDDPTTKTRLRLAIAPETSGDTFVAGYPLVTQRLNELDGFSTTGGIAVAFTGPIDGGAFAGDQGGTAFESLDPAAFTTKDAPLLLVDVDPASPDVGKPVGLLPRYFAQAKDDIFLEDEYSIVARPAVPLAPGRRYLFVATSKLVGADGLPVARSAGSRALLGSQPKDAYGQKVHDALAVLEQSVGVPAGDVVVASVFTTTSQTSELDDAVSALRAAAAPALTTPWTVEQTSEGDARIAFRATYASPEMRSADGTFVVKGGLPEAQGPAANLEVLLAFSNREVSGPRPIVIYQHGLGGDKGGSWGAAERLSDLGVAVVSIDSPEHGSRGAGATGQLESVFAFFGIDPETYAFDLAKARDNFRQMTIDQVELVRFLGAQGSLDLLPVGAPDGVPDLDPSRILYIGHSFGSVQGPAVFALMPEVKHAVWNVGGDGLMMIMEDSELFGLLVDTIKPFGTTPGQLARFFSATQAIVDPGDPLNYAPRCLFDPPEGAGLRSVLLQEVMKDGIVPNTSTEALARAARLSVMDPIRAVPGLPQVAAPSRTEGPGGTTAVLTQFDTMNGGEVATHGELYFAPEGRDQYVEFFRTALDSGVGTVFPAPR